MSSGFFSPDRDANMALEMMASNMHGNDIVDFSSYSACYCFSNENLSKYYPMFNMNDGRVLTVCGSGDQVFMAILQGAKEVDCFDTNLLSYYNLMLKKYAIMNLDYSEFLTLFNLSNRSCNRKNIYIKLRLGIFNEVVRTFWDRIFSEGEFKLGIKEFFPYFFKKRDDDLFDAIERIPFLAEDSFNKLKELLGDCDINFINTDLSHVFDYYDSYYDFINLSNIFNYVNVVDYVKFVKQAILHLNQNGAIMANYSWNGPYTVSCINDVSDELGAEQRLIPNVLYDGNNGPGSIMVCSKKL